MASHAGREAAPASSSRPGPEELPANLEQGEDGIWFGTEQTAVHYPEYGNELCRQIEERSFWFRHRNDCVSAVVQRYFPPGRFFDIGGGNGFVALALKKIGHDVVLVEPGREGAACARKRGIDTVICSGIESAGFPENSLKAVGAFDVIEHLPDDVQFLRTLWRYMAEDGRIVITVPAYQLLWSTDDEVACHFRRYSMGTLLSRLRQSGFRPEYHTYFFSFLPLAIFLFRTLPSWLGVRKGEQVDKEHDCRGKASSALLNWLLGKELRILSGKGALPFGGSCLVVARKVTGQGDATAG
jgi:SAM-dependent methyltransferase